jgi:hypothetical protein
VVGVALDVGVAALGVHAAPGTPHVAEQELEHRPGADELHAGGVVGEADRVDDRHHLVRLAGLADQLGHLEELVLGDAGDALDHLRGVAAVVLAQQVEHRAGMLEVHLRIAVRPGLVRPGLGVVDPLARIVGAEDPVLELVALLHHQAGVGRPGHVLLVVQLVLEDVVDQPAEVGDVRPGPDP